MSNFLSPHEVRRRTLLAALFAGAVINLVGCGKTELKPLAPEAALPNDPYDALQELHRRILGRMIADGMNMQQQIGLQRYTSVAGDGSQIVLDLQAEFDRSTVGLTRPSADWRSMTFSHGQTQHGGRYIDGVWTFLSGSDPNSHDGCHVLLTSNPDVSSALIWAEGRGEQSVRVDFAGNILRQMLSQAAQITAIQSNQPVPALGDIKYNQ